MHAARGEAERVALCHHLSRLYYAKIIDEIETSGDA
jgi:hypothetical protein